MPQPARQACPAGNELQDKCKCSLILYSFIVVAWLFSFSRNWPSFGNLSADGAARP